MKFDFSQVRSWLGYSRRERRASFILLILIVSVISLRFLVPEKMIRVEEIPFDIVEQVNEPAGLQPVPVSPIARKTIVQRKAVQIVDINRCDTSELISLPGIGPVLSLRIIKYRQLLGGYVKKDQLREVYGLPAETYEIIKDMVSIDTTSVSRIEINYADYRRLSRMPYFDKGEIASILKFRELEGRINSIGELVENKLIGEETAEKVKPYLSFK